MGRESSREGEVVRPGDAEQGGVNAVAFHRGPADSGLRTGKFPRLARAVSGSAAIGPRDTPAGPGRDGVAARAGNARKNETKGYRQVSR